MKPLIRNAEEKLASIREKSQFRSLKAIRRVTPRECELDGRRLIDFSSNDYMGLSMRGELIRGAVEWTEKYGTSSGASRLISGTSGACLELEAELAEWKGFESALLVGSGYSANLGAVAALADRSAALFADKLNHASINTGCLLSGADFKRYRHNDMTHLKKLLDGSDNPARLILSDTVFSMDGDIAPLRELHALAEEHDALLYLDDAHGTGVLGAKGEGLVSPANCDVALATLSKAVGAFGGALLSTRAMRDYLINCCSPFIFSTALPPSTLGAIQAAIRLLQTPELCDARENLHRLSAYMRGELQSMGYDCGPSETMIIPVILGDAEKTLALSRRLMEHGILALAVRPPTVPAGTSRLRVSLNACHTKADVDAFLSVLRHT